MTDPADDAVGQRVVRCLRDGSVALPGTGLVREQLEATRLGTGESYVAWRLTDGDRSVVFRLPRRPPEEMPCPMADEFTAARRIPEDVGSRAVAMQENDDNPLGFRYLVATFVPGRVRAASEWDETLLRRHAHQLARLHGSTAERADPVGSAGPTVDIVAEFDRGLGWWRDAHPEIAGDAEVVELARVIRGRLTLARPAFENIDCALIHGDMVATNVVVDHEGTPRYIDWEWARIGDVAQDLAYVGGHVAGGPWYVRMDADTVTMFLTEYQAARTSRSGRSGESVDRLHARRDAWELVERYLSGLHFARRARDLADPGPYPAAVRELRRTLWERLDG